MREIKFACPHCGQHIACDEAYCGYQIRCPTCQGGLIIPHLAVFGFGAESANLSLALPVATPVPRQATATGALPATRWSEKPWDRNVTGARELTVSPAWGGTILLVLFFAPALIAMLFADSMSGHRAAEGRGQWLWTAWMVFTPICAILCAAGLSQAMSKSVPVRVLITVLLAPFIWGLNASISLFLGCVAGLISAAGRGG